MMAKRKLKVGDKLRHGFRVFEYFPAWGDSFIRPDHLDMGRLAVAQLELAGFFEFAAFTNPSVPGRFSGLCLAGRE